MSKVKLKICPFCGDKPRLIVYAKDQYIPRYFTDRYAVQCEYTGDDKGCGAESGHYKSKEETIENWNKRHEA